MANINKLFPSKWMKASDLAGHDRIATVRSMTEEPMHSQSSGKQEMKPCLAFDEFDKPMVLNKTNAQSIAGIVGSPDTQDWIGKQVVLYPDRVQAFGEIVDAIRVKAVPPALEASDNGADAVLPNRDETAPANVDELEAAMA